MICKVLPVFCYSEPTISITKSAYEMHIIIFFMCKCERHSTNNVGGGNTNEI